MRAHVVHDLQDVRLARGICSEDASYGQNRHGRAALVPLDLAHVGRLSHRRREERELHLVTERPGIGSSETEKNRCLARCVSVGHTSIIADILRMSPQNPEKSVLRD